MLSIAFLRLVPKKPIPWFVLFLSACLAGIGIIMLYSAGKGFAPWALKQSVRFGFGVLILITLSRLDVRFWCKYARIIYVASFALLIFVEALGFVGMGAKRWIDLYIFQLQPSELMKISLILMLAHYFHRFSERRPKVTDLFVPTTCHKKHRCPHKQ